MLWLRNAARPCPCGKVKLCPRKTWIRKIRECSFAQREPGVLLGVVSRLQTVKARKTGSIRCRVINILFCTVFTPVQRRNQVGIQRVPGSPTIWIKGSELVADDSPSSGAEVKDAWS
jgi:hypothetical protein